MKKLFTILISALVLISCSSDDDNNNNNNNNNQNVDAPATYQFTRNGENTVSYSGQTQRIAMAEELISALKDNTRDEASLDAMFAHAEGDQDFSDPNMLDLNASSKNVRSKTAASKDYFDSNTTDATAIKADFDSWISLQVSDVFPNWGNTAEPGIAGGLQEFGGGSTRYVNEKGLEYNQAFAKTLTGALMTDQILNNYLSSAVLDAGDNVTNNDNDILADGKDYTTMEHKWDEAFGYLYGLEEDETSPELGVDSFLNKYLDKVEGDSDFAGIADDIYDAFKLGRAAIVAKNYTVRDEQVEILREKISMIIGIRAVYYLQGGKANLGSDWASAFHDLSEGFGFVYGLQFTRNTMTDAPYVSKSTVDGYINTLMEGNGFWDLTAETLDQMSEDIAAEFGFTVEEAAN